MVNIKLYRLTISILFFYYLLLYIFIMHHFLLKISDHAFFTKNFKFQNLAPLIKQSKRK